MTGQGKSEKAKQLLLEFPRVIIFDPQNEYDGYSKINEKKLFNPITVLTFPDLCDFLIANINSRTFIVRCKFRTYIEHEFTFQLVNNSFENVCLVLEEVEKYVSPVDRDTPFNQLVNYGRHNNVSLIAIGRRMPEFSTTLRSQSARIISFYQNLPLDIQTMNTFGLNVEKLNEHECVEKIL